MYRNTIVIKRNNVFLKQKGINFSDIETCLHVLSTDPMQLEETYNYVVENYGINAINKTTSILSISKDKIIALEDLNIPNIPRSDVIKIAAGRNDIEEIKRIIQSEEFKKYPHLFTSTVLAHAKLEEIIKIIQSEEFKKHPDLFTSTVLAHAKLEEIKKLLLLEYWNDVRYKNLLSPCIVSQSKSMVIKLPILIKMEYNIDSYLNAKFLIKSPSQDYALINYLLDNDKPFVNDGKLNSIFSYQPGVLKSKYNIDLKELMQKYPFQEEIKII